MTEKKEIYRCSVCGNIVEVVYSASGTLVCCGKNMELMRENNVDAALEKHVPVLELAGSGIICVKVGEVLHPMEKEHHIEWIELLTKDTVYRKYLQPGDIPKAEFQVSGDIFTAREYCNLHGLWKK